VAEDGLLEIQFQVVTQIGAAKYLLTPTASASAKNIAEDIAKDVAERISAAESTTTTAARRQALVTVLIVNGALLFVRQYLVGLLGLFEFLFGLVIVRIAVRVKFHGQTPIRLLQFGFGGCAGNFQHHVVIALGHVVTIGCQVS
jgi:hypothetical protein